MADNPVAGGHHQGWRRPLDCRLLAELCDAIARVDGIPEGLLEALYAMPEQLQR
jgi:hypothetical protein